MANNIIFTGIKEEKNENCKKVVSEFVLNMLNIEINECDIFTAHRLEHYKQGIYRSIIAVVLPDMRERIIINAKKLKGKKNDKGSTFYISVQQAEVVIEVKKNAVHLQKIQGKE